MGFCILNTIVLPTPETLDYLQQVFSTCPVEINWDALHVTLGPENTNLFPSSVYAFYPGSLDFWYNDTNGGSALVLPLYESPKVISRAIQLGRVDSRPFHLSLKEEVSTSRRHHVFFNSLADSLVAECRPLKFHNEMVAARKHSYIVSQEVLTLDMRRPNLIFLPEDEI